MTEHNRSTLAQTTATPPMQKLIQFDVVVSTSVELFLIIHWV